MLGKLKSILKLYNYKIFSRPYELNIVGLRSKQTNSNRFDDEIHVFYKNNANRWVYHLFKATTDPGTFWLQNPMQPQGTAILAQGQYLNAYAIGLHQGKYNALVQARPVTVIRDYDRNAMLDFMNGTFQSGMFGINIHRAKSVGITKEVDKYSAGCQVFENATNYENFMRLCEVHRSYYGNVFTYTLIDFRAIRRINLRRMAIGGAFVSLGIAGYLLLED